MDNVSKNSPHFKLTDVHLISHFISASMYLLPWLSKECETPGHRRVNSYFKSAGELYFIQIKTLFFCFQDQIPTCFETCNKSVITCAQRHQTKIYFICKELQPIKPTSTVGLRATAPSLKDLESTAQPSVVTVLLLPPDILYQIVIYMNNIVCRGAVQNLHSHTQSPCLADPLW